MDSSSDSFVDSLKLPTFPSTVARIDAVLQDAEFELSSLAEIVAQDPPIAASVLRSANSAYYGLEEPVNSLREAVGTLGARSIRNLAFQAAIVSEYKHLAKYPEFDLRRLWKHSIMTAQLAQALATQSMAPRPGAGDLAYTAGLLHDIGKIVLLDSMGEFFLEAVRDATRKEQQAVISEDAILGMNHATTGSLVGFAWKLPEEITRAIEYHHDESAGGSNPTLAAVVLADHIAGFFATDQMPDVARLGSHRSFDLLGLDLAGVAQITERAAEVWPDITI